MREFDPPRFDRYSGMDRWFDAIGCASLLMSLAITAAIVVGIILAWKAWG